MVKLTQKAKLQLSSLRTCLCLHFINKFRRSANTTISKCKTLKLRLLLGGKIVNLFVFPAFKDIKKHKKNLSIISELIKSYFKQQGYKQYF